MIRPLLLTTLAAVIAGCAATENRLRTVESSEQADSQMLGALASLEGDWQMQDQNGDWIPSSEFKLTSAGSMVREIMFPGSPNEMTNTYHMDGTGVVCTHYCAAGNQPRMVASSMEESEDGRRLHFKLHSVSNYRPEHDHFMGEMTLTLVDANTLQQNWKSLDRDGNVASDMTFVMKRLN